MAAADLRAALSCCICREIYKDPVTLTCGHNFCQKCITEAFDHRREQEYECPECRKSFRRRPELTRNPTLKSIAEACRRSRQEQADTGIFCIYCDLPVPAAQSCLQCELSMCDNHMRRHNQRVQHTLIPATTSPDERKCSTHKKILDYFCKTDSSCICASCVMAGDHGTHLVEPLEEAFERKKEKLRNILEELASRRKDAEERLQLLQGCRAERQRKVLQPVEMVIAFFIGFRQDLEDLEKKVLDEIYKQEERQLLSVSSLIQHLEMEKILLSSKMCYIQNLHETVDPVYVLKEQESSRDDFCDLKESEEQDREKDHKELPGASDLDLDLISEKLNTLSNIIAGIKNGDSLPDPIDISLNINTAGQNVHVAEDRKTATWSHRHQKYPETPERFHCNQVISNESVSSGQRYWDVETSETGDWKIGVCYPSIDRRERSAIIGNNAKSWCLHRCNNPISLTGGNTNYPQYSVVHDDEYTRLSDVVSCNRVRITVDYEGGQLSFYELCDPIRHLHTFTATFTEPLHATCYVWDKITGKGSWVRITGSGGQ